MDFFDGLDVELEKEFYYPGETINGFVLLSSTANVKIRGIHVTLRGKVQVQWKVVRNGAVYTVKNCHILVDQKQTVLGPGSTDVTSDLPVLKKGTHKIMFSFVLKDMELPSSFESKLGSIRYLLQTGVDIPYASPPQNVKHFSVIGRQQETPPHEWLVPITLERHNQNMCMACSHGCLSLEVALNRTAFCCGENMPLRLEIVNGINLKVWPIIQLIQKVDYCVDKTGFGIRKDIVHVVWEYKGPTVPKQSTMKLENLSQVLQVPVMPPTTSTCDIIRIEYKLKVSIVTLKWGEPLHVAFPILITPFYQKEDSTKTILKPAIAAVEGGNYRSPELQCGAVYDGTDGEVWETTLYQPVYVCVPHKGVVMKTPSTPEITQHQPQTNNRRSVNTEIEVSESRVSSL